MQKNAENVENGQKKRLVYLIRHAMPDPQKEIVQGGRANVHLGELGAAQSHLLGLELKRCKIDCIECSLMYRARETLWPYLRMSGFPEHLIHYTSILRERDYGDMDGRSSGTFDAWKLANNIVDSNFDYSPPNGESFNGGVMHRARIILNRILNYDEGINVAVLSHFSMTKALILNAFGETAEQAFLKYPVDNASITIIEFSPKRPRMVLKNYTRHLKVLNSANYKKSEVNPLVTDSPNANTKCRAAAST